jgi:hypothetical protein
MIQDCEGMLADREMFSSSWATQGVYSVSAVIYTLQLVLENDVDLAVYPAQLAVESAYLYVMSVLAQRGDDQAPLEKIMSHSALQRELEWQRKGVCIAQSGLRLDDSVIARLRIENQEAYIQVAVE